MCALVTGVQTCSLPIYHALSRPRVRCPAPSRAGASALRQYRRHRGGVQAVAAERITQTSTAAGARDEVGPRPLTVDFPWGSVPLSVAYSGQRRLEARTYLTDGYGLRRLIEDGASRNVPMSQLAAIWQPSRLKGYVVAPGNGRSEEHTS